MHSNLMRPIKNQWPVISIYYDKIDCLRLILDGQWFEERPNSVHWLNNRALDYNNQGYSLLRKLVIEPKYAPWKIQ